MISLDDLISELNNDIKLLDEEIGDESSHFSQSSSSSTLFGDISVNINDNQQLVNDYNLDLERINKGIASDIDGFLREFNDSRERVNNTLVNDNIKDYQEQQQQQQQHIQNNNNNIGSPLNNGADIDIVHAFTEWRLLIDEEVEELYLLVKKLKKNSKLYNNNSNKSHEAPSSPILTTRDKHPELYMHNSTFTNILQLKNDLIGIIKQFEKSPKVIQPSGDESNQINLQNNHDSSSLDIFIGGNSGGSLGNGGGLLSKAVSNPDMNSLIPSSLKLPPVLILSPNGTNSTNSSTSITTANVSSSTNLPHHSGHHLHSHNHHLNIGHNSHASVSSKSAPSSPRQRNSISSASSPSTLSSPSTSSSNSPSSSPSPSRRSTSSFMQSTQSSSNKLSSTSPPTLQTSASSTTTTPNKSNRHSNSHLSSSTTTSSSHPTTPTKTPTRARANSTSTPTPSLSLTSPLSSPVKKSTTPTVKPTFTSIVETGSTTSSSNSSSPPLLKQSAGIRKPLIGPTIKQLNRTAQEQEEDVKLWIQKVLDCQLEELSHHPYGDPLLNHLQSGVVLCRLLNALIPDRIKKINNLPRPFFQVNNIDLFLQECASLGVDKNDLFFPFDLHNIKENAIKPVLSTIYSLARATNHLDELRNISNTL